MSSDQPPPVDDDPPESWFWEWPPEGAWRKPLDWPIAPRGLLDRLTSWMSWR